MSGVGSPAWCHCARLSERCCDMIVNNDSYTYIKFRLTRPLSTGRARFLLYDVFKCYLIISLRKGGGCN